MKKTIIVVISMLFLVACNVTSSPQSKIDDYIDDYGQNIIGAAAQIYRSFEQALLESATDIVIVQYVGSKPYGQNRIEFEFIVVERILGDATDRIFVRAWNSINVSVSDHERNLEFLTGDLTFSSGVNYLLPLRRKNSPYTNTDDSSDQFAFINNLVINLDEPSNSIMYSEPLDYHIVGMRLDIDTSTHEVISFIKGLAAEIAEQRWEQVFIRSELIEDIIMGSPYVWVIEVNDPVLLAHEMSPAGEGVNDIYDITVVQSLKGDVEIGESLVVSFFANTVRPGEEHIVAVQPLSEDYHYWFIFTSRNSLFRMDQLEEIMLILDSGH